MIRGGTIGPVSTAFADLLWKAGLRSHSAYDRIAKGGRKAAAVASGDDRRKQQELSFHSLRHTARTWLEECGQPKAVIDAFVGHSGDMGEGLYGRGGGGAQGGGGGAGVGAGAGLQCCFRIAASQRRSSS